MHARNPKFQTPNRSRRREEAEFKPNRSRRREEAENQRLARWGPPPYVGGYGFDMLGGFCRPLGLRAEDGPRLYLDLPLKSGISPGTLGDREPGKVLPALELKAPTEINPGSLKLGHLKPYPGHQRHHTSFSGRAVRQRIRATITLL